MHFCQFPRRRYFVTFIIIFRPATVSVFGYGYTQEAAVVAVVEARTPEPPQPVQQVTEVDFELENHRFRSLAVSTASEFVAIGENVLLMGS